jgi:hypothetical protein
MLQCVVFLDQFLFGFHAKNSFTKLAVAFAIELSNY